MMPLPKPSKNESKDDFIRRCMASSVMSREFGDPAQRRAVCEAQWDGQANAEAVITIRGEVGPLEIVAEGEGDTAYWDDTNNQATNADGGGANKKLGLAVGAAGDNDTKVRVQHVPN